MSNENNRKGVIVGLFVFFGIVIIIAGVLTLGGQKKTFVKAIHVRAIFKDVNGLAVGNNIWFSGVKVGTIKSINFAPDASVIVVMNLEEKVKQYIHEDSKAKIGSDGLIGNKIVVIYGGSANAPEVKENSTLAVEAALDPEQIMTTLQANNKNLLAITGDFKVISERLSSGKGSIGKLLTDESVYNELTAAMTSLKSATSHANVISKDLAGYTDRLKTKGSLADDLVSDTVLFSRLRATVTQMNDVADKANGIVSNLSQASSQFNNSNTPIGALLNDQKAASDLKETLRNLSSGTAKLDENMEALQHNFLFRGFFRKKARQAGK
ncbi:MAG: MCE family protein [Chitinophagaceae bacterium]|nr:MCE family protein [Chitinophagaceae bacterium]